ncbi:MAG: TIGR00366 family protein, partial [Bacilli bacterium]|nr:TIGR00366 family protein [Bacilli bacterium]
LIAIVWYFYDMLGVRKASFSLDLNMVNFIFLIVSMALYKTPIRTVHAVNNVASGAAGVMLQFPFYGGIAGMMTYAGGSTGTSLAAILSNFFINISNNVTYPIFVMLSAGIVNFFVPSGGGQWAVQGPIVMPTALTFDRVTEGKAAMAIAWGDCWTNLIQPFWALPLLAVAKLQARDIMGYCIIALLALGIIIIIGMLIP